MIRDKVSTPVLLKDLNPIKPSLQHTIRQQVRTRWIGTYRQISIVHFHGLYLPLNININIPTDSYIHTRICFYEIYNREDLILTYKYSYAVPAVVIQRRNEKVLQFLANSRKQFSTFPIADTFPILSTKVLRRKKYSKKLTTTEKRNLKSDISKCAASPRSRGNAAGMRMKKGNEKVIRLG